MSDGAQGRTRGLASLAAMVLLLVSQISQVSAEERSQPVRRAPASVARSVEYSPDLLKTVPADWWTEYPAVCLYSSLSEIISADGTAEDVHHTLVRVNNLAAVEEQGECRLFYEPEFQTFTLNEARVHTAAGAVIEVKPEHLQVRDANTDYQVYSSTREVIISFPGLGVGDVLELQWTTKGRDLEYAPEWCLEHYFNNVDNDAIDLGETHAFPIRKAEVSITLPQSKALKYAFRGRDVTPKVTEEGHTRTYRWTTSDVMPPPQLEPLPRAEDFFVGLVATTFPSWDAVARWELELRSKCRECTAVLREELQRVTEGSTTLEARVRNLCRWVRSDLRYLSHGHGARGNHPHLPGHVVANRFGDCKDKCQLLSVLFTELNVPHEFVVLTTEGYPEIHPDVPSPIVDHIFLKVDLDGKSHWIDPTGTFNPWNQIRDDCSGRNALIFNEKGSRIERLPDMDPEDWRIETQTELAVSPNGDGRMTVNRNYHRLAAADIRSTWLSLPRTRRKETISREMAGHYAVARVRSLTVDEKNLADPDQPLTVQFVVDLPGLFDADQDSTEMTARLFDTPLWDLLLIHRPDLERDVALDLPQAFHVRHAMHVTLPTSHLFYSVPKKASHDTPWGHGELDFASGEDPHQLSIHWEARVHHRRVSVQDLERWREFDDALSVTYAPRLGIDFTSNPDDERVLRAEVKRTPREPALWEALLHLLMNQGQPHEARKILRQARKALPDNQRLAELSIELAESSAELEQTLRKLVDTWPDEDRYRVSLGVALLDRGKLDEAEKLLNVVATNSHDDLQYRAMIALADLRVRQKRFKEAAVQLEEVVGLQEQVRELRLFQQVQGRLLEQHGDWEPAREFYDLALDQHPDDADLLAGSIRVLRQLKDRKSGLRRLWSFVAVASTAEQLQEAAQFSLLYERWEDAELLATQALEIDDTLVQAAEIQKTARAKRKGM